MPENRNNVDKPCAGQATRRTLCDGLVHVVHQGVVTIDIFQLVAVRDAKNDGTRCPVRDASEMKPDAD